MRYIEKSNAEIEKIIDDWVHSERDRRILKARLIDGTLFEDLAENEEMSVRHIQNIVYKYLDRLDKKPY